MLVSITWFYDLPDLLLSLSYSCCFDIVVAFCVVIVLVDEFIRLCMHAYIFLFVLWLLCLFALLLLLFMLDFAAVSVVCYVPCICILCIHFVYGLVCFLAIAKYYIYLFY